MYLKSKLIIAFVVLIFTQAEGQISSVVNFIKGGQNDAEKLISAYLLPIEKSTGFNGANSNILLFDQKDNEKVHFGIGLDVNTSLVNSSDFTYNIDDLALEEFEPVDPQFIIAQTVAGDNTTVGLKSKTQVRSPSLNFPFYKEHPLLTLQSPKGSKASIIPLPTLHLLAEKEGNMLDFKMLPRFKIQNGSISVFDIGLRLQHNLGTSISALKDAWIDVYLSAEFNWTSIKYALDIKPNEATLTFSNIFDSKSYEGQSLDVKNMNYPLKMTWVKNINDFSFFLAGVYNLSSSTVGLVGEYPIYATDPTNTFQVIVTNINDPFEYQRHFNHFYIEMGANYTSKHFVMNLKYAHSYYKNLDVSIAYLF